MQMLSDDDLNIRSMSDRELDAAWDLWFDLAQETNAYDPAYSHGVLVGWAPSAGTAELHTPFSRLLTTLLSTEPNV